MYTTDHKIINPALLTPVKHVDVDLVFERAESVPFAGKDILSLIRNPCAVSPITKIAIYRQFTSLQPYSIVVRSPAELLFAVTALKSDTIVVKEQEGYGGHGVCIGNRSEMLQQMPHNQCPMLVQEFLDTSIGVPGHGPGVHDVRIEICDGEITSAISARQSPAHIIPTYIVAAA